MVGFSLFRITSRENKEAPGDEIPGLLSCGLTGGIRTLAHPLRQRGALSAGLQPDSCGDKIFDLSDIFETIYLFITFNEMEFTI